MSDLWNGILLGAGLGIFNGAATRWALRKALGRSKNTFFMVWAGGMFYRMLVTLGLAGWLAFNRRELLIPAALTLIVLETLFQIWPIKRKDNGS